MSNLQQINDNRITPEARSNLQAGRQQASSHISDRPSVRATGIGATYGSAEEIRKGVVDERNGWPRGGPDQ